MFYHRDRVSLAEGGSVSFDDDDDDDGTVFFATSFVFVGGFSFGAELIGCSCCSELLPVASSSLRSAKVPPPSSVTVSTVAAVVLALPDATTKALLPDFLTTGGAASWPVRKRLLRWRDRASMSASTTLNSGAAKSWRARFNDVRADSHPAVLGWLLSILWCYCWW